MPNGVKIPIFTHPATRVLYFAQDAARKAGLGVVGTEHILLGLVKEQEGVAARILKQYGINATRIHAELPRLPLTPEKPGAPPVKMVLSDHAKQLIEDAIEEAHTLNPRFGLHYVCTEYILLAIIKNCQNADMKSSQLLLNFQVDTYRMSQSIMTSLAEGHQQHGADVANT